MVELRIFSKPLRIGHRRHVRLLAAVPEPTIEAAYLRLCEDDDFWDGSGVEYRGIARVPEAEYKNPRYAPHNILMWTHG